MEAYLDNSATTCVYQETADLVCDLMVNHYGNPSAMHQKGVEAEQYIRTAQETLAKILKVKEKEIFFTSGGTESDNWGACRNGNGKQENGKPHHHKRDRAPGRVGTAGISGGAGIPYYAPAGK